MSWVLWKTRNSTQNRDDEDEDEVNEEDVGPDPEPVTVKFSRAEAKKWFNVKSRIATRDYGSLESSELHKARIYAGCVAYGRITTSLLQQYGIPNVR